MALTAIQLGPGTLILGDDADELDASCKVEAATVSWDKTKADDKRRLCGQSLIGPTTYSSSLAGTFDQDLDDPTGLLFYTWAHRGEVVPFVFVPNTAAGAQVSGSLTVDPLDVGGAGDDDTLTSDFEWSIVGDPVLAEVPVGP